MARSKYSRRRSHHKRLVLATGASAAEGLQPDQPPGKSFDGEGYEQDTPGRPKSASSRQQTQPGQAIQSGSAELDGKSARQNR